MTVSKQVLEWRLKDNKWRVSLLHLVPLYGILYGISRRTIHPLWCSSTFGLLAFIPAFISIMLLTGLAGNAKKNSPTLANALGFLALTSGAAIVVSGPVLGAKYGVEVSKRTALMKLLAEEYS
jgi:sorbitol-specific phosphotransferase system component IIBC